MEQIYYNGKDSFPSPELKSGVFRSLTCALPQVFPAHVLSPTTDAREMVVCGARRVLRIDEEETA